MHKEEILMIKINDTPERVIRNTRIFVAHLAGVRHKTIARAFCLPKGSITLIVRKFKDICNRVLDIESNGQINESAISWWREERIFVLKTLGRSKEIRAVPWQEWIPK